MGDTKSERQRASLSSTVRPHMSHPIADGRQVPLRVEGLNRSRGRVTSIGLLRVAEM